MLTLEWYLTHQSEKINFSVAVNEYYSYIASWFISGKKYHQYMGLVHSFVAQSTVSSILPNFPSTFLPQ